MSNSNQNKPGGKSGQRGRKPVQELTLKAVQPQNQKPLNQKPTHPPDEKPVQSLSQQPVQPPSQQPPSQQPTQPLSQKPTQPQSVKPEQHVGKQQIAAIVAPVNTLAIDFQTIATAYSNYSKKSFEQTKTYVEKLAGVRSLDKAIEIQTEFAKQAYETFVAESQKIRELYSGLAKQSFKPLEGVVAKTTSAAR
jgi:Phasin protein